MACPGRGGLGQPRQTQRRDGQSWLQLPVRLRAGGMEAPHPAHCPTRRLHGPNSPGCSASRRKPRSCEGSGSPARRLSRRSRSMTARIHPRGVADAPEVTNQEPGPGGWLYRLEVAGHGPIRGRSSTGRGCPPRTRPTCCRSPMTLPVLDIVRVGRSARDDSHRGHHARHPERPGRPFRYLERDESAAWPWPDQPGGEPDATA